MTYTDEDVQRLVVAAGRLIADAEQSPDQGMRISVLWTSANNLQNTLKPFRPDPEEELIEAMVEAMKPLWYKYPMPGPPHDELARAALAVVREKGSPE